MTRSLRVPEEAHRRRIGRHPADLVDLQLSSRPEFSRTTSQQYRRRPISVYDKACSPDLEPEHEPESITVAPGDLHGASRTGPALFAAFEKRDWTSSLATPNASSDDDSPRWPTPGLRGISGEASTRRSISGKSRPGSRVVKTRRHSTRWATSMRTTGALGGPRRDPGARGVDRRRRRDFAFSHLTCDLAPDLGTQKPREASRTRTRQLGTCPRHRPQQHRPRCSTSPRSIATGNVEPRVGRHPASRVIEVGAATLEDADARERLHTARAPVQRRSRSSSPMDAVDAYKQGARHQPAQLRPRWTALEHIHRREKRCGKTPSTVMEKRAAALR